MEMIANILLICGTLAATAYCIVLSRRLRRFTDLETGVGGAIAVLSLQVDEMTKALGDAQGSAVDSAKSLGELTRRAEGTARRLELLVAAMHDLPPVADEDHDGPPAATEPPEKPVQAVSGEDTPAPEQEGSGTGPEAPAREADAPPADAPPAKDDTRDSDAGVLFLSTRRKQAEG